MAREVLGFVGLGAMGSRMARRLLEAGYTVVGYNRTPARARPLVEAGMRLAATPRQTAEAADVIFSMVSNTEALYAVAQPSGRHPGRSAGGSDLGGDEHSEPGGRPQPRR